MADGTHPEYGRPGGPPTSNPGWYRGDGGQWRLDPVPRVSWLREGQHAVVGGVTGALPYAAYWWGDLPLVAAALVAQFLGVTLFLAYEVTEGWRIRDWAYRDIGGFMAGMLAVTVCGLAATLGVRAALG